MEPGVNNSAPSLLRVGRTVGDYVLLSELGRGGFGVVYEAEDQRDRARVALKTLRADLSSPQGQRALTRFLLEVRAARQIRHPNVVRYIDAGQLTGEDGSILAFYAMELLAGETLEQLVRRSGPMKPVEAASVIRQAAVGLYTAHCQGIIHRDIKPGNIMLTSQGRAVVTDFGVCKIKEMHNVTAAGQVVGTARYLAPEQFLGAPVDARSDIFALGALLYYLLTGEHLRIAKDLVVLSRVVARGEDVKRVKEAAGIPQAFRSVLVRAVAREPSDRYKTALDLAHALEEACLSREVQALAKAPPRAVPLQQKGPPVPPPVPAVTQDGVDTTLREEASADDVDDVDDDATEVAAAAADGHTPSIEISISISQELQRAARSRSPWMMVGVMVLTAVAVAWLLAMWVE
ncbi:MAG: serine/threonine protein kinase [Deltaproteobacteria bacterium]|nr:serine/threonine protein kinase [Deltaproteobacteria bacterium]